MESNGEEANTSMEAAEEVLLRDGQTAMVRTATETDHALVAAFVRAYTAEPHLLALFGVDSPLESRLPGQRHTLLAYQGSGEALQLIGAAVWVRPEEQAETAEVGFLVHPAKRRLGLASILLERLALSALQTGIHVFEALLAQENREMLQVLQGSGFELLPQEAPPGWVRLRFAIRPNRRSIEMSERRERVATIASLVPFFRPKSVAVIGASRNPDAIGRRIFDYLIFNRFQGPAYPVNPSAQVVGSVVAYPSVSAIPGPVDLAVIAVPRDAVLGVIEECGKKGIRAAVIITAGFSETGREGRALQARLVEVAHSYGMRIIGPNGLGLINTDPAIRLNASFSPIFPPHGHVAMSSQSGALGLAILQYAQQMELGLSNFVSIGNKADVSGNDLMEYWEEDPQTDVILLYLESIRNPVRFARVARRVGCKKPVIVVKSGRTSAGHRAAGSHTAALAANESLVDALFAQSRVLRVDTLEEMFDLAALLADQPLPAGRRVAVVTNAGGPGILATDALASMGLEVSETPEALREQLRPFLPAEASLHNPVDMIASATADQFRQTLEKMLSEPGYDAAMAIFIPVGLTATAEVAEAIRQAVRATRTRGIVKPVIAVLMDQQAPATIEVDGTVVPNYRFPESAARALARAYQYAQWRTEPEGNIPDFPDLDIDRARALVREAQAEGKDWLSPEEIERLFACFHLPTVTSRVVPTPDEAGAAAEQLGFPVVVKMVSQTLQHKSEWGGVVVGLQEGAAVRDACASIAARLHASGHADELDGFLIQQQVVGGIELMVGMTHDPQFGPLVAFGLGGIYVEVLRDVVFRITPLTDRNAYEMVRSIRGYRLLEGFRGTPPADVAAIEELLLRVSRMVEELPELAELDLNPVIALPQGEGCRIVDARVRLLGSLT
ncbi:MAG: acetate--CoA ligase family protein [Firmicutes bacterium]|nr:acetate--CoA ligase family protein [Bacillota bacterium]